MKWFRIIMYLDDNEEYMGKPKKNSHRQQTITDGLLDSVDGNLHHTAL